MVRAILRGQWRSVIVECGALSAMMAGTAMLQQWSVNNWGSREQVGCDVRVGNVLTAFIY